MRLHPHPVEYRCSAAPGVVAAEIRAPQVRLRSSARKFYTLQRRRNRRALQRGDPDQGDGAPSLPHTGSR